MNHYERQRPLSLPNTLVDFFVTKALICQKSPNDLIVEIIAEKLSREITPFDLYEFEGSELAQESLVKLLLRIPYDVDEKLLRESRTVKTVPNRLIFQFLLEEYKSSK